MAESYKNLLVKKEDVVSASSTKVVDTIALAKFKRAEYSLYYFSQSNNKTKTLKLVVVQTDSGLKDQLFAKGGNLLDIGITATINGSNFELTIINNESFVVDLVLTRLKT